MEVTMEQTISWDNKYICRIEKFLFRLHDNVLVTAGLDGIVGVFHIIGTELITHKLMQANEDMVAAVDFDLEVLITGSEDAVLAVWDMSNFNRIDVLMGHTGGITGVQVSIRLCHVNTTITVLTSKYTYRSFYLQFWKVWS